METIRISQGCTKAKVELVEAPSNPYKNLLGQNVWEGLDPERRFEAAKDLLVSNSEQLDEIKFTFRVTGLPRHQFAQHDRARIGVSFEYQNPESTPSHFLPYTPVYKRMFVGYQAGSDEGGYFEDPATSVVVNREGMKIEPEGGIFTATTEFGRQVIDQFMRIPQGSWKEIRDYLPLCYEQPYNFRITLRALRGQCSRRLCLGEEAQIVTNHYLQKAAVGARFPLLASVLNPACVRVGKCLYAKSYTLSNAFGCLFSGCDYRHPKGTTYASFNKSCSDIETLIQEIRPIGTIQQMDNLPPLEAFEWNVLDRDRRLLEEA